MRLPVTLEFHIEVDSETGLAYPQYIFWNWDFMEYGVGNTPEAAEQDLLLALQYHMKHRTDDEFPSYLARESAVELEYVNGLLWWLCDPCGIE